MIPKERTSIPHLSPGSIVITNTRPEHIPALAALQPLVFPQLTKDELLDEARYHKHLELFPAGQFVALIDDGHEQKVVGATSTFRTSFDFAHIQHTFMEVTADGWFTHHDPDGEWLYGADLSIHPDYRGRRIGRRLYEARQELVQQLNLRGEIAGALIPGYHYHHKRLSVAQYVLRVKQGHIFDPTLSMQLRNGFKIRGLLYNHLTDPRSHNCASLIVRENRNYQPSIALDLAGD